LAAGGIAAGAAPGIEDLCEEVTAPAILTQVENPVFEAGAELEGFGRRERGQKGGGFFHAFIPLVQAAINCPAKEAAFRMGGKGGGKQQNGNQGFHGQISRRKIHAHLPRGILPAKIADLTHKVNRGICGILAFLSSNEVSRMEAMTHSIPSTQPAGLRDRWRQFHHRNEAQLEVLFFLGGFVFDALAVREGVDHLVMIVQQVIYLSLVGLILYLDFLREAGGGRPQFSDRLERIWAYRGLALHFFLGTLMNIYSLFFLMSASFFSSAAFVLLLLGTVVANELKAVRERGVDVKIALYVVCIFCFFSLMFPLLFGHVGLIPFSCSFFATLGVLVLFYRMLRKRLSAEELGRRLMVPGLSVSGLFLAFYLVGLVPPVPLSAKKMGVYHKIEKAAGSYVLFHERPWWKIWQSGDQEFLARPGDKLYFFAAIFSPARFDDRVYVHWYFKDPRRGWMPSDRIPLHITGGRKEGFRGFTVKQNFGEGDWRVSVEASDGREIGRMYFSVAQAEADPGRVFLSETY
jgi:Protein of unknown function (DUF2914)